jgi:hypothetical protein
MLTYADVCVLAERQVGELQGRMAALQETVQARMLTYADVC